MIYISVQQQDFSHAEEYQKLVSENLTQGAVVTFTGRVRGTDDLKPNEEEITALELECYPGMTEKVLNNISKEATHRWPLGSVTIIHRIGKLTSGEQIVFVGVTSSHRKAAFEACEFLIDILKTEAPFWKKEFSNTSENWVEAKQSDSLQSNKWLEK